MHLIFAPGIARLRGSRRKWIWVRGISAFGLCENVSEGRPRSRNDDVRFWHLADIDLRSEHVRS